LIISDIVPILFLTCTKKKCYKTIGLSTCHLEMLFLTILVCYANFNARWKKTEIVGENALWCNDIWRKKFT
jgi:hypothetical protein